MSDKPHSVNTSQLQFLRFLAFFLIFLHHLSSSPFGFATSHGSAQAVSFFFLLGGFAAALSLHPTAGKYPAEIFSLRGTGRYFWGKLKKVYPLHFVTLWLSVAFCHLPHAIAEANTVLIKHQITLFFRNALLLQSWYDEGAYEFNGVSWFLSSLLLSYLLTIPASALLNKLHARRGGFWGHVALFVLSLALIVGSCRLSFPHGAEFWQYNFPPARFLEYFCGMTLCHIFLAARGKLTGGRMLTALFSVLEVLALGFWVFYLFLPTTQNWAFFTARWLLPNLLLIAVFSFGSGYVSTLLRTPPLKKLGDISFECFLIHQLVIRLYAAVSSTATTANWFAFGFCLLGTLLVALYLNRRAKAG